MAQIIRITSEALQATIRRLLPSQQGFGEDLQASNVIQPIIDLTPTAEGVDLRSDLQRSLDKSTTYKQTTTVDDEIGGTGFNLVWFNAYNTSGTTNRTVNINIQDGLSTTKIYEVTVPAGNQPQNFFASETLTIFVPVGNTLHVSPDTDVVCKTSSRQLASVNGVLTDPSGYTPQ